MVAPARTGRGYGFVTLGLHKIAICCLDANAASRRVIEKLGCRFVGLRRDHFFRDGRWWDQRDCEMTKDEYRS